MATASKTVVQMQRLGRFGRTLKADPQTRATALSRVQEARRRFGRRGTRPAARTR